MSFALRATYVSWPSAGHPSTPGPPGSGPQHTGSPGRCNALRPAGSRWGRMEPVKTRTLIILAIVTGALIVAAGVVQIVLGRYVQN